MSDEKPISGREKQDLADALAAMSGGQVDGRPGDSPSRMSPQEAAEAADDDAVIAPPPDRSAFVSRRTPAKSISLDRAIELRRTFIPVLLTLGVLLPIAGALKWLLGPDSPFAAWPTFAAAGLIILGQLLLDLAVLNMVQVKRMTTQRLTTSAAAS